VLGSRFKTLGL